MVGTTLLLQLFALNVPLISSFQYQKHGQELTSPEMICVSASSSSDYRSCPSTVEESQAYDAVVMDEHGYVNIRLKDVRMRDDGRRKKLSLVDDAYYAGNDSRWSLAGFWDSYFGGGRRLGTSALPWHGFRRALVGEEEGGNKEEVVPDEKEEAKYEKDSVSGSTKAMPHHLQVYLVPLEQYEDVVTKNQCCYELEFGPPFPDWVTTEKIGGRERAILPKECSLRPGSDNNDKNKGKQKNNEATEDASNRPSVLNDLSKPGTFAHDYRVNAPRIGQLQATTGPISINESDKEGGIDLVAKLRPTTRGRHMVVVSNCAAEVTFDPQTNRTRHIGLKAVIGEIEITFVSKFGELPISMMGIIPFYGFMFGLYAILSLTWWKRSGGMDFDIARITNFISCMVYNRQDIFGYRGRNGAVTSKEERAFRPPLLGLQRAISVLVFSQLVFSAVAFIYYLHLNGTSVDIDVLYSGTAAALVNWGPFSVIVAAAHFITLFGCQAVVTLATDGTWLIQHSVRPDTKRALYILGFVWFLFFVMYGFMASSQRNIFLLILGIIWVIFLLFNVRRSLRHIRTLMVGNAADTVMAVGGALVAKRSLYRKMCGIIAIYPVIFLLGLTWTWTSRQDSWAWVGYVLGDIYLFIILLHASITWMPRPMAGQEYVKYAPLEVSVETHNDMDLWEEDIGEKWGDDIDDDSTAPAMSASEF